VERHRLVELGFEHLRERRSVGRKLRLVRLHAAGV
jgi:hypothetical protein